MDLRHCQFRCPSAQITIVARAGSSLGDGRGATPHRDESQLSDGGANAAAAAAAAREGRTKRTNDERRPRIDLCRTCTHTHTHTHTHTLGVHASRNRRRQRRRRRRRAVCNAARGVLWTSFGCGFSRSLVVVVASGCSALWRRLLGSWLCVTHTRADTQQWQCRRPRC
jgi:hypothetical protein